MSKPFASIGVNILEFVGFQAGRDKSQRRLSHETVL